MARPLFQSQSGTQDLFSPATDQRRELVSLFANEMIAAGYGHIVPPMFEDEGVFHRLGEASDVVSKELYSFEDKGGRNLALRPEFTASVCRVFAQHKPLLPWKVWYEGPSFRQERPQKGRYRQFDQVGAEVIGSKDPDLDTELIALCWNFFSKVGLSGLTLLVNSLGDVEDRSRYLDALSTYFESRSSELSEQSVATMATNPLRVLDSKRDQDFAVIAEAPLLADYLGDDAAASFERVQTGLRTLGIPYEIAPRLVRGLDYYNRTIFEFASTSLDAAQNAVGGGGRYDGLVADLGGGDQPGVGFALGVDRILLACEAESVFPAPVTNAQVWVVVTTGGTEALEITAELRSAGLRAGRSFDGRSMKAQMKAANRSGADVAVIVGQSEAEEGSVSVRRLRKPSPEKAGTNGSAPEASSTETSAPTGATEMPKQTDFEQQSVVARSAMLEKVRSILS